MAIARIARAPGLGLLALAAVALAAAPPALAGEVVFRAKVKDLWMSVPHLDRGKTLGAVIQVVLSGELFDPPRELGVVSRAQAKWNTPEAALRSDFSAWKADDAEWIRANFAAGDQAALAQFLADAEIRAGSKAGFAKLDSVFLWGLVRHEVYALALITYGQVEDLSRGLVATLIEEAGAWKRTNALSADETLDVVWSAFRAGEMAMRP